MKKISSFLLMAGLTVLVISGCKGKDNVSGDDPKAVLSAFFERMEKKDIDGAAKLCTKESKSTLDIIKKGMDAAENMKSDSAAVKDEDNFKDMELGEVKIDGENATVQVSNKKDKKTVAFPLKREDGSWKVDFTMATLMKMGMDESNKNNDDFNDNNTDTLDMNMNDLSDTIRNEMDRLKDELKRDNN